MAAEILKNLHKFFIFLATLFLLQATSALLLLPLGYHITPIPANESLLSFNLSQLSSWNRQKLRIFTFARFSPIDSSWKSSSPAPSRVFHLLPCRAWVVRAFFWKKQKKNKEKSFFCINKWSRGKVLKKALNMHRKEAQNLQFNLRLANCFLPQCKFFPLHIECISQLVELSCAFVSDLNVVFLKNCLKGLNCFVSEVKKKMCWIISLLSLC